MGLIDKCIEHNGEYCTVARIDTLLQYQNDPVPYSTGGIKSGCCIPPQCAKESRDAKARVFLCDLKLFAVLEVIDAIGPVKNSKLLPINISFENVPLTCGYGRYESTVSTMVVYFLIAILAGLILFASVGEYFCSVYQCPRIEQGVKAKNCTIPEALRAFSFQRNWNVLTGRPERATDFLDGIRALSFMWVVLGHVIVMEGHNITGWRTFDNTSFVLNDLSTRMWFVMFVISWFFSIDSFFWLGGFIFSYIFISKLMMLRNPLTDVYK